MASSSRTRSSSPFSYRRTSSAYNSSSSSSSNHRLFHRSYSSSANSIHSSSGGNAFGSRSMTPNRSTPDSFYAGYRGYDVRGGPAGFASSEEWMDETLDAPRSADCISVTIRFRPLSEREYQRGDEIAWYADGDKLVRNEYNLATAYAFGIVSAPI